jgi:hypothetical protein
MTATMDVRIEWDTGEEAFAAGLLRDGEPWILGGALVGMGVTRAEALGDLAGCAAWLAATGTNYLLDGELGAPDRAWLARIVGDRELADAARLAAEDPAPAPGTSYLRAQRQTRLHLVTGGPDPADLTARPGFVERWR